MQAARRTTDPHRPIVIRWTTFGLACALAASLFFGGNLFADAVVTTKAMTADTIVEIYIERDEIRVEFEIGSRDFKAFANVLPDSMLPKATTSAIPLSERAKTFFASDWTVEADGAALAGQLIDTSSAKRILRDEVTGLPLPVQPEDAETVAIVRLRYPLKGAPKTITLRPRLVDGGSANIGFVVYHERVAVNDFRYLSRAETLKLDWTDPWYSAFESRTLRRQYYAPAAAFIYVENFEVRKEIVIRPKDLQRWVDLGLEGAQVIKAEQRDSVRKTAAEFLQKHTALTIDNREVPGGLDRIHFISRTLRTSGIVEPGADIPINDALLGAIYVYPIEALPDRVTMTWDLFDDRIQSIPSVANDEAGDFPSSIDKESPTLVWKNYLTNPTKPGFLKIPPPSEPSRLNIPLLSTAMLVVGGIFCFRLASSANSKSNVAWVGVAVGSIAVAFLFKGVLVAGIPLPTNGPPPDAATTQAISSSLLRNMYSAFDRRQESRIYDVLDRSVSGELLNDIYLQTRRSLTLASQGGARVKVKKVEVLDCLVEPDSTNKRVTAHCRWTVTGSVGHWGHIHQRQNLYDAELVMEVIDGQWKLLQLEVLSEERL